MKVHGVKALRAGLENVSELSNGALSAQLKKSAIEIQVRARAYAPVKTGGLESGITVEKTEMRGRANSRYAVFVDESRENPDGRLLKWYARLMHRGPYNLGPGSRAKAQRTRKKVGPRFLVRALDDLTPKIKKDFEKALDDALAQVRRKARKKAK